MNIAIFTDTYYPEINGVATSCLNLATVLKRHGENVLVVTTNPFSNEVTYEDGVCRIPGIEVKAIYGYRLSNIYNSKAMKIIKEFKPDVIHCQTDIGVGIFGKIVADYLHIGSVWTFHTMIEDYAWYLTKGHFDRASRKIVQKFFKGRSKAFAEAIAPSLKIKDYLRGIGVDMTIDVIPTGIEISRFDRKLDPEEDIRKRRQSFGIKDDEFVVLFLGRLAEEKNIDFLLRGFSIFTKQNPDIKAKFVITGLGPSEPALKELAVELGISDKVVFTGKCKPDDTPKYYHMADAFACASTTETQGLTYIEAMASSNFVLARFDTNLSTLISDGQTGFFFFNEEDFAGKLRSLINLDDVHKQRILDNSMKSIDKFSMDNFYFNIIKVYKRVAKKHW